MAEQSVVHLFEVVSFAWPTSAVVSLWKLPRRIVWQINKKWHLRTVVIIIDVCPPYYLSLSFIINNIANIIYKAGCPFSPKLIALTDIFAFTCKDCLLGNDYHVNVQGMSCTFLNCIS